MNCKDIKTGYDTGGTAVFVRRCYCGTTACLKTQKPFGIHKETSDELSQEEEREFYRKTLHSRLLCDDKNCDICPLENK